jgi:hypothetical protein
MFEAISDFQRWLGGPVMPLVERYWWVLLFGLGIVVAAVFFPNSRRGDVSAGATLGEDGDGGDGGGGDGGGGGGD